MTQAKLPSARIKHLSRVLFTLLLVFFGFVSRLQAQYLLDKPTLGIEIRPVIPSDLFVAKGTPITYSNIGSAKQDVFTFAPQVGFSAGAVIRTSLSRTWSIESGIYYTSRHYTSQSKDSVGNIVNDKFRFDNYEVPILGLIYIRLAKYWYINNAFGLSFDFLPNDILTPENSFYAVGVARQYWVLPALMANVGAEYRTPNSGYFYIGALYHRMLIPLGNVIFEFNDNGGTAFTAPSPIDGHYFALDFKYFFPTKRTPVPDYGY